MKTSDFSYQLPDELIARYPTEQRSASRLLVLEGADISHKTFVDIEPFINPGDLLVVNNTEVIAARLFGKKATGGKLEMLVERVLDEHTVLAHVKASRSPKPQDVLTLFSDSEHQNATDFSATMLGRQGALFELSFNKPVFEVLEAIGHMPLPPYIDRADEKLDESRYQTVYAQKPGAVAAPTAGLHFDEALISRLKDKGVDFGEVTLHVGAGTFQPVKVDDVNEHQMHKEWLQVDEKLCEQVKACKARGNKVVAVGTTSVRALETASQGGTIKPFVGETDIFIYPGFVFNTVDVLITNFHLPESTLLMLVSAFAGKANIEKAYQQAVENKYRFFSYGDAMLLFNQKGAQ